MTSTSQRLKLWHHRMQQYRKQLEESDRVFNAAEADNPCPVCGHVMSINSDDLLVCKHRLAALKACCEEAPKREVGFGLTGVRIHVVDSR